MLATRDDLAALESYYRTVAPFYPFEAFARDDLGEWVALAQRIGAHRILDLGCGSGRVGRALLEDDPGREIVGVDISRALLGDTDPPFAFVQADMRDLPLDGAFDLILAANDPFAHLLDDDGRAQAIAEARRLLSRDGLLVVDGLHMPPQDDALAASPGGLVRERTLADGLRLRETWRAAGDHRYDARFEYHPDGGAPVVASTRMRAWHWDEKALRESCARLAGAVDERDFDPWGARLVAVVPGWS